MLDVNCFRSLCSAGYKIVAALTVRACLCTYVCGFAVQAVWITSCTGNRAHRLAPEAAAARLNPSAGVK